MADPSASRTLNAKDEEAFQESCGHWAERIHSIDDPQATEIALKIVYLQGKGQGVLEGRDLALDIIQEGLFSPSRETTNA